MNASVYYNSGSSTNIPWAKKLANYVVIKWFMNNTFIYFTASLNASNPFELIMDNGNVPPARMLFYSSGGRETGNLFGVALV